MSEALSGRAWIAVWIASAILYGYAAYRLEQPFLCDPAQPDPSCSTKSTETIVFDCLSSAALIGLPALLSVFMNRSSKPFLIVWSLGLAYWTYVARGVPLFIDGRHGCVLCDDFELPMIVVSWGTFVVSAMVWLVVRALELLRPASR